jgi:hypothetical protein
MALAATAGIDQAEVAVARPPSHGRSDRLERETERDGAQGKEKEN